MTLVLFPSSRPFAEIVVACWSFSWKCLLCGCGFPLKWKCSELESCEQPRCRPASLPLWSATMPTTSWGRPATLVPNPRYTVLPPQLWTWSHPSGHSGAFAHHVCSSPCLCTFPRVRRVQVDPSHCQAVPVPPPAVPSKHRCGGPTQSPPCP